ncbi:monovalent cation:proton antiporter-2 (CPA2) family protein [Pseudolabrys sp. FHR47]|uniref:monovalent cation:proton antiporter-2 (CPA2) family protein n=1 Tax=Pseudolabrys sp. FHR47 TaxID=2562284 RepID=UPI0010BE3F1B|nr:monovalent cation:proton antiporter-2 (CPA2) family protein [Pseudolabrys sp. FHR47]
MLHAEGFKGLIIFLIAAGVIVPLFHRARISTVLGFLLVGVILGPFGLGRLAAEVPWVSYVTFDNPRTAEPLAELGIIFLLFILGLELSVQRLWQLRRYVLGVGLFQVAVSSLAIGFALRLAGAPPPSGIVLGMCIALSSTAIVMQLLVEQHRSASPVGRVALSVLLFQDLMVVPILFIVGMLGGSGGADRWWALFLAFAQAIAAIAVIMLLGRYLVRPLLRSAAHTGSRDLIMAITLLIVVGIAAATGAAGLSVALGAFLAGLLLSESEYRHHIEVDLEPFKGLLLGIFFVTVGTTIDPAVVLAYAGPIVLALAGLIAVKAIVLYAGARLFGVPRSQAVEVGLLLSQAGEFAFVVIALARQGNLLPSEMATATVAVVGLSMMLTPVLAHGARIAGRRLAPFDHERHAPEEEVTELRDHVVIGGFGRVGRMVADLLDKEQVPYVALDMNEMTVDEERRRGRMVFFGDASRTQMLERAGARKARAFVITLDAPRAAERMVQAVMHLQPKARVFARAKDIEHASKLTRMGVVGVIPEAVEASLQLGARVLEGLEIPDDAVSMRLAEAREKMATELK